MPLHEEGFDLSFVLAPCQFFVPKPAGRLCFETHGGDRKIFIDNSGMRMIKDHLVDCSIDLLTDMATEALAAFAARRGELSHPLLLQTGAEFRFAPSLLSVTLVPLRQLAMKRSVMLARRGRDKIGDPHIDAHARG
jgi:hypothetical protein